MNSFDNSLVFTAMYCTERIRATINALETLERGPDHALCARFRALIAEDDSLVARNLGLMKLMFKSKHKWVYARDTTGRRICQPL